MLYERDLWVVHGSLLFLLKAVFKYKTTKYIQEVVNKKYLEFLNKNNHFYEKLPYELMDTFDESLLFVAEQVAKKVFSLGFSMATKLTAESFVKLEKSKD